MSEFGIFDGLIIFKFFFDFLYNINNKIINTN